MLPPRNRRYSNKTRHGSLGTLPMWLCNSSSVCSGHTGITTERLIQFIITIQQIDTTDFKLVQQMGTSMRPDVFTENVVMGLKRWRIRARKNLKDSNPTRPNRTASLDTSPSLSHHVSSSHPRHIAIEVVREDINGTEEQPLEHKKNGSFEGFGVESISSDSDNQRTSP